MRIKLRYPKLRPTSPVKINISLTMSQQGLTDFLNTLQLAASTEPHRAKKQKTSASLQEAESAVKFGYTDINKFEHCARLLQKNIRTIVDEAPTESELTEYASDEALDAFAKLEAKTNALLRLVAKLKTNYSARQLQIFDDILENSVKVSKSSADVAKSNAKKPKTEPKKIEEETTQVKGLPPLPAIRDPELLLRVFQHKSTSANKTYLTEQEIVLTHNERMEFLGDSVINTIVTFIIYEQLPTANEGQLSQLRSSLVSNKVLAEFSVAYGLAKQLRCNIEEEALKAGRQKVFADVFEAYVGALSLERKYDFQEIEDWIRSLMASKLSTAMEEFKKVEPVRKEAKAELYSLIGSAVLHPVYKVVETGNGITTPFKVQCIMEDEILAEGEAPSLKDAGLKAAMIALTKKETLEKYGRKRLEMERSVSSVKSQASVGVSVQAGLGKFPLVADSSVYPNKFAKNEAYAYFGKNLGMSPEYRVHFEKENKRFRVELTVKEVVICVAYDELKKDAMARAATMLLQNKDLLPEIVSIVN